LSALRTTIIYGLVDPRNNQLRYVGKTIQPLEDRLRLHVNDAQKIRRRHVCTWIRSLQREGFRPEIFEIERVGDDWVEQEKFWIAYFRFIGSNLTNETCGGEGVPGRKHTLESRAKMSEIARRTQSTPEVRRLKSERTKAQHSDPLIHAHMVESVRAAFRRPDVIANSNAARVRPDVMARRVASIKARYEAEPERQIRRGLAISAGKLTPEARLKASESQRRRHIEKPFSAEVRAHLSALFKGRKFSEETRKRMSESAQKRWAK
jgi:hypothetical protein